MHSNKFANISSLDRNQRYDYFIRKVSDSMILYSLYIKDTDQIKPIAKARMVLWPELEFATTWSNNQNIVAEVRSHSLHDFFHDYLLESATKNIELLIFPTLKDLGVSVHFSNLEQDLRDELKQYE